MHKALSPRQLQIAEMVAGGKTSQEISRVLFIDSRTVDTHVKEICNRLGVNKRTEIGLALFGEANWSPVATTNLPHQQTDLIGREDEIATIVRLFEDYRLVTVTGSGGVGKTRVALAAGGALVNGQKDDAWLVDFAKLTQGAFVAPTLARSLGIAESPKRSLRQTLLDRLKNVSLLLIFDNCEHVIADAAALADLLLRNCPRLRILATSREPLKLPGEQTYRLPSLRVPSQREVRHLTVAGASDFPAVALLLERARSSDVHFSLSETDAPIAAVICRRLDGIPLAIELAAARVNVLSLRMLLSKLDHRLRLLSRGDRTALPRHQTMRALIDWSYDLLAPAEQRLFERLSIFAGGCDLLRVSTVCGDEDYDQGSLVELLSSLIDKSLVVVDFDGAEPRYRLLETTREYASEKLRARGDEANVARRHAATYMELAAWMQREYDVAPDAAWHSRASTELENWRAALQWTLSDRGDIELGQRLAGALSPVWLTSFTEGRRWINLALELSDARTPMAIIAQLEYASVRIADLLAEYETVLAKSLNLVQRYEQLGDSEGVARAQGKSGEALVTLGRFVEAEPLLWKALKTARLLGQHRQIARMLEAIAQVRSALGDIAESRTYIAEAIEIYAAIGAEHHAVNATCDLAEAEFRTGHGDRAVQLLTDSLAKVRGLGRVRTVAAVLTNLGAYLIACDRWEDARGHTLEALRLAGETEQDVLLACVLQHLVALHVLPDRGSGRDPNRFEIAARLLGFINDRITSLGSSRGFTEQQEYDRLLAAFKAELAAGALEQMLSRGASMAVNQAIYQAISLDPQARQALPYGTNFASS